MAKAVVEDLVFAHLFDPLTGDPYWQTVAGCVALVSLVVFAMIEISRWYLFLMLGRKTWIECLIQRWMRAIGGHTWA